MHAACDGISEAQYAAIESNAHADWGRFYWCPSCRRTKLSEVVTLLSADDARYLFAEPVTEDIAPSCVLLLARD